MKFVLVTLLLTTVLTAQRGVRKFNLGCKGVTIAVTTGTPKLATQLTITGYLRAFMNMPWLPGAVTAIGLSNTAWGGFKVYLQMATVAWANPGAMTDGLELTIY